MIYNIRYITCYITCYMLICFPNNVGFCQSWTDVDSGTFSVADVADVVSGTFSVWMELK